MATGDTLLQSLSGLNFSPLENPFGQGASILATSLPKIINPSGSVGTNLAVALGGTILSALLGYQARNQANELTQQANRYALDMLKLPSATDRLNLIQNVPDTFYGSDIKSRLADVNTSLEYQQRLMDVAAGTEKATEMAKLEALTSDLGQAYTDQQTERLLAGIAARGVEQRGLEEDRQANRKELAILRNKQMSDQKRLAATIDRLGENKITSAESKKIKEDLATAQNFYDLANAVENDPDARLKLSSFWKINPLAQQFQLLKNDYLLTYSGAVVTPTEEDRQNIAFGFTNLSTAEDVASAARSIADKMVDGVKVKTTMPQSLPDILYSVDQWKTTRGTTPIYDIFQQNLPEASSILTEEQKAAERPRLFQEKDKLTADFAAARGVASPELKARAAKLKREFQMFGVPFQ
jgi:hypothetical protein